LLCYIEGVTAPSLVQLIIILLQVQFSLIKN